jgi:hypothetical protein
MDISRRDRGPIQGLMAISCIHISDLLVALAEFLFDELGLLLGGGRCIRIVLGFFLTIRTKATESDDELAVPDLALPEL